MPPRKSSNASATQAPEAALSTPTAPPKIAVEKPAIAKKKLNGNGSHAAAADVDASSAMKSVAAAPRKKSNLTSETLHPDPSIIELRAWEIWVSEGCPQGRELEHWLRAEREVLEAVS